MRGEQRRQLRMHRLVSSARARIGPIPLRRRRRDTQHIRRFLDRQAGKVPQLHQLRFSAVVLRQRVEPVVDRQHLLVFCGSRDLHVIHVHARHAATVTCCAAPPCTVDQDPPHRLRRCAEEMRSVRKPLITQPQPRFVHERRRLQRVARPFARPSSCARSCAVPRRPESAKPRRRRHRPSGGRPESM